MNRPLTENEAAIVGPLVDRLTLVRAQAQELELGISAAMSLILGRPAKGAQLTTVDDCLTIIAPDTPDEIARKMEALVAAAEGGD